VYSADPEAGAAKLGALDPEDETTKGQFRTASLLNIAETGPYFHNGSARTLEDVMWHYNNGGGEPGRYSGTVDAKMRPLGLTEAEMRDVVAFLRTLTGEPVPQEWRDDPFAL
jgi:cytochrome c peroxidase